MNRLPIGHPARVLGMDSASMIVGRVWRNGGIVYALRGVAGVWPNAALACAEGVRVEGTVMQRTSGENDGA